MGNTKVDGTHGASQSPIIPMWAPGVLNLPKFMTINVDERQITHLICARIKYDLYDFFTGVLGLLPVLFLVQKAPTPPKKVI